MIEFKNVYKSFGSRTILKGLNLHIPKGKIVFVLGMSGTGKSVLLKNIVGLLKPDSGEILVDEFRVHELSEKEMMEVRKVCGMVFQQPALFDFLTVFENVAYGLRKHFKMSEQEIRERVSESLRLVGMSGSEEKEPHELSYGMKKRVSLARTVALKPKILLFDEPTTGLDPISTSRVNELILNLSKELGTTSIVVSHDMKSALTVADHIIVLDKGNLLTQGSPIEMKNSDVPLIQDFMQEV
ncbi:MAG: ABC transporter ATP-binding protein [Bdellovibrionales bacterium]|nr:ABC transporter ATP-binding protein [Bdellovibrionales bacterium]NQZ18840.1 ABC transporter ATP-binding protein [Bdellovibrionales bacterium]